MSDSPRGKVHLVGAGPGDPGLVTLRAVECLRRADLVLYDYLVNPQILEHAAPTAELVCLGRHGRGRIIPQEEINRQLEACGWSVQHYREMNISASLGVAVEYFQLKTGEADYLLYVNGRAAGVIEVKAEGHTLTGVETQSAKYTDGLPDGLPHYHLPIPFAYESTGTVTQFTNNLEPDARSREQFTFHRPDVDCKFPFRGRIRQTKSGAET